ncbi:hypothetical protein [Halomonas sp. N3-2A]|nr:hypothetical protein [Halomonas sp. N3-2A]
MALLRGHSVTESGAQADSDETLKRGKKRAPKTALPGAGPGSK